MSDSVKGMRYFHICSIGTCKNPGLYPTKYGETFCKKCVVKYITKVGGVSDFWPHGIEEVIEVYNTAVKNQESEQKERMLQNMWDKEEREAKRPIKAKHHRKK